MQQNVQTHSNNSSAVAGELFESIWSLWGKPHKDQILSNNSSAKGLIS